MAARMVFAALLMALVSVAVLGFGLLLVLVRVWACVVAWCMSCSEMLGVRGSWSRVRAWAIAVHASGPQVTLVTLVSHSQPLWRGVTQGGVAPRYLSDFFFGESSPGWLFEK